MNSSDLLRRAAAAMCGEGAYNPKSTALVQLATMQPYSATQALERASCRLRSGAAYCSRGDDAVLAEAKAKVCRVVGFPHIDLWEWHRKPDWQEVRDTFLKAA
jgi:hypothetical protein